MNYQDLLAAKIQFLEVNAIASLSAGSVLAILGITLLLVGWVKAQSDFYCEWLELWFIFGAILTLIALACLADGAWGLYSAEIKAKSELANYGLVEILNK